MLKQGTDEWRQARCGSIGASDAPKVMRKLKSGGFSQDRAQLMADKFNERLTRKPKPTYKSWQMLQGTEREPDARDLYRIVKNVEVEEIGLVPHPLIRWSHASPDGLVGARGLVELKCPEAAQHLETLENETVSQDHFVQVQWQMACTGRDWVDYVSYNPEFPGRMQFWHKRINRDGAYINDLEREIRRFIAELDAKVARLTRRYEGEAA